LGILCWFVGLIMDELSLINEDSEGPHDFRVYKWDNSEDWRDAIVEKIGSKVREVYTDYKELQRLVEMEEEDIDFDFSQVNECISEILENAIPSESDGGVVSTPRSDFPELIASLCLESLHDTVIPVNLIEKRETLDKPGRGVDVLGYEKIDGEDIQLVLGEVKGSSEDQSPPQVITGSDSSMDEQLKDLVLNEEKIIKNLMSIFRKAENKEDKRALAQLIISVQESPRDTRILLCPFLVRELEKYQESDYHPIKNNAEDYEPHTLRFLAVCVDENLTDLSVDIYEYARDGDEI